METQKIFAEGIFLNTVHQSAPDFIKANVSINVKTAIAWLTSLEAKGLVDAKGYVRLVGKESQAGKRYFEVDQWKPKQDAVDIPAQTQTTQPAETQTEEVPF